MKHTKHQLTCAMVLMTLVMGTSGAQLNAKSRDARHFDGSAPPGPKIVQVPPLRYAVIKSGSPEGLQPSRNSAVRVRYTGSLDDGSIFDQSSGKSPDDTVVFPVRSVIPGFSAALQMMRPGDEWIIYIPAALAYPNSGPVAGKDLIFRIELLGHADLPPGPSPIMKELPKQSN